MIKSILIVCAFLVSCTTSFAAKWLPLPTTDIKSKCPPNNYGGIKYPWASYCGAVLSAWGGAVWDDDNRRMYIWGGGHGNYGGNEIYRVDISPTSGVTTTRFTEPDTGFLNIVGEPDEVPGSNNPVSRHTYGNMAFLPAKYTGLSGDKFWIHGGSKWNPTGGFGNDDWLFDINTKTWTKIFPPGDKPGYIILFAAYHPGNNKIYMTGAESSGWNSVFYTYDVAANSWSRYVFRNPISRQISGLYGAHRSATLVGDDYYLIGSGGLWKINVNGVPDKEPHLVPTTGDIAVENAKSPGIAFDSKRNLLVGWIGTTTNEQAQSIYTLNLSTLVWTKTTVAENAPLINESGCPDNCNGTFGRFAYSSKMDCYVVVTALPSQNAVLYCPDDYPTDLWFGRTIPATGNNCENGRCKHVRMGQIPGNDEIYFFGGDHGSGSANSDIYTYNVNTNVWTNIIPKCAADGTLQLDGMDEGGLFYNTNNGKFYYFFMGNYCSQKRDNATCAYPNRYNPNGAYGSCANSAMVTQVNLKFDPITKTWDTGSLLATVPSGFQHWAIYDSTLNKAFVFSGAGRTAFRIYKYDIQTAVWTARTQLQGIDFPYLHKGHWAHDVSARKVYFWDNYSGKVYKYDIATDTASLINSNAPRSSNDQPQSVWDSTNNILLINECYDAQTFPMRFHSFKPSTNTWAKNIIYNTWAGKSPWGRESFYDGTHNLLILLGYENTAHGTNQIWFYRYGGGAGTKPITDATPLSTPKTRRKTP